MAELLKKLVLPIQTKDVNLDDYLRPSSVLDYFQDIAGIHANEIGVGYLDALKKNENCPKEEEEDNPTLLRIVIEQPE